MSPAQKRWREENKERWAAYRREWYAKNKAKPRPKRSLEEKRLMAVERNRRYRERHLERVRQNEAAYRERKREACNARIKTWKTKNTHKVGQSRLERLARERMAVPRWADRAAMVAVYAERVRLERETGVKHHVDHIVPLIGKSVCGLHWEGNLRVVPATVNLKKNRHSWPDMP